MNKSGGMCGEKLDPFSRTNLKIIVIMNRDGYNTSFSSKKF